MSPVISALAIAFAAFCVWLAVRIINRRERWAKWTLAASVVVLPLLYVASLFPITLMVQRDMFVNKDVLRKIVVIYLAPAQWLDDNGPAWVESFLDWIESITEPAD
jgi:hypothetical protein